LESLFDSKRVRFLHRSALPVLRRETSPHLAHQLCGDMSIRTVDDLADRALPERVDLISTQLGSGHAPNRRLTISCSGSRESFIAKSPCFVPFFDHQALPFLMTEFQPRDVGVIPRFRKRIKTSEEARCICKSPVNL
jgi:hypothetical protein